MGESQVRILAVDAGHTRVKFGWYEVDSGQTLPPQMLFQSVAMNDLFSWSELISSNVEISSSHALLTGSNQKKIDELVEKWPETMPPLMVLDKQDIPIQTCVDFPEKVGADRLLNAVAVNKIRQHDRPAVIVDSGTAMTVDAVDERGEFLGGAILPGILMSSRGLHEFTSTLPLVDGRPFLDEAPQPLGKNTEDAIASGLYWGHLGAAKELIARVGENLEGEPQLFITGGAQTILDRYLPRSISVKDLSLVGIVLTAKHLLES